VVTAVLLGIARIVGETAPLLFTAFGSQIMNANPVQGPQEALPLVVFTNIRLASSVLIDLAYQAGFVLMAIVLILFVAARIVGRQKKGKKQTRSSGGTRRFGRGRAPSGPTPTPALEVRSLEWQSDDSEFSSQPKSSTDPMLVAVLGESSDQPGPASSPDNRTDS
jgi:hypothetical protein